MTSSRSVLLYEQNRHALAPEEFDGRHNEFRTAPYPDTSDARKSDRLGRMMHV
jgi:hypothetical protein